MSHSITKGIKGDGHSPGKVGFLVTQGCRVTGAPAAKCPWPEPLPNANEWPWVPRSTTRAQDVTVSRLSGHLPSVADWHQVPKGRLQAIFSWSLGQTNKRTVFHGGLWRQTKFKVLEYERAPSVPKETVTVLQCHWGGLSRPRPHKIVFPRCTQRQGRPVFS